MGSWGMTLHKTWQQLCSETGAQIVNRGFWHGGERVELTYQCWTIVLDIYTVIVQRVPVSYTRIRAPFVSRDGFSFSIRRGGVMSAIGKLFGGRQMESGDAEFDELFTMKSNDEQTMKRLLSSPLIKELFCKQRSIDMKIVDDPGYFKKYYPENVNELTFSVSNVIKDVERLKSLFQLFCALLTDFTEIGIAVDANPGVTIR